ncbi:unnamed protein product [Alopecurus aequalis]
MGSFMAISSRAATCTALVLPSTPTALRPAPLANVSMNQRSHQQRWRKATAAVARASSSGAVLDQPAFDQSQLDTLPAAQEDDARHTEKLVEKALPQVVPSVTAEAARQLFHESRQKGAALVIVVVKEHAEFYAQMMVRQGLRSAIEPESDVAT